MVIRPLTSGKRSREPSAAWTLISAMARKAILTLAAGRG
jgi:hypothetical protein